MKEIVWLVSAGGGDGAASIYEGRYVDSECW